MFLIAITGGIATGKTTVTNVFRDNGVPVVDADLIARQIVEPGEPAWHKIKEAFGDEVFNDDRTINRDALGKIIFKDKLLRRKLNEITHPVIHRSIIFQVFRHFMSGEKYIILDLPLLFETGILIDFIHKIITVTISDPEIQVARLIARNSMSEEDARRRIDSQMPLEAKCEKSQFVIDNTGSIETTRNEALKILELLKSSNHHWRIRFYMAVAAISFITIAYYLLVVFG